MTIPEIGTRWESRAYGVCISVERTAPYGYYQWAAWREDGTGHRTDWFPNYRAASDAAHFEGYRMAGRKDMPRLRRVKTGEW